MVGEPFKMVDEILARVGLLRHGSLSYVLVADVAVEIDHHRHHGLALELDAHRPRGDQHVSAPPHRGEPVVLDDKRGVLDDVAVAREEARPFENRHAGLTFHLRRNGWRQEQTSHVEKITPHIFRSAHDSLLRNHPRKNFPQPRTAEVTTPHYSKIPCIPIIDLPTATCL